MVAHSHCQSNNHSAEDPNTGFAVSARSILCVEVEYHCVNQMLMGLHVVGEDETVCEPVSERDSHILTFASILDGLITFPNPVTDSNP